MLRFHRGWGRFRTPEGGEVWSLTTNERFGVNGDPRLVQQIFEMLDRGDAAGPDVEPPGSASLIEGLRRIGAVIDDNDQRPGVADPDGRYVHQSEFFSLWETPELSGGAIQDALRGSTVLIVGVGAFGTWIALNCARIGIGTIILVDPDTVEATNLPRQVLYRTADVGRPKVEVAAEMLAVSDPSVKVVTHDRLIREVADLADLAARADLVFNSFGYRVANIRDIIAETCVRTGTPSLLSGGSTLGPLCVPGRTACYQCMVDGDGALAGTIDKAVANRWLPPRSPFAPLIAAMSSLAVWEATRFLTGCSAPLTENAVWSVDLFKYEMTRITGDRRPSCAVCGTGNDR
ncbi:hypothetical protein Sru01_08480 [Sphaerisporangium rufum]|uniref:THIF-type NAD/FAD binding fold domain-containing protein n=1 Tax=Sphaerisporangium rufum TaxID=1381558 RepID=A0A919UWB6_9ACTN|nr:ThiF family adenylyltransferase [Sphaerisporangium rufum]GII75866.1 hypothetical protein Sru01_08480 [Sphaerisporangium rufum]